MSNLLQYEDSPYLQQHKDNPVDWHPWRNDAFLKAKEEMKIIFISIGYSTCHWCHVMEREVFEDEEIAKYMNEHFVCIKVDKEERPDIDKQYQLVYQTMTNKPGGWPTSIFATSENLPFYATTYIPADSKYNIVGFRQFMHIIVKKFKSDKTIHNSAQRLQEQLLQKKTVVRNKELDVEIKDKFIDQCKNAFEPIYGGFTIAPKFPQVATLNTMITLYELQNSSELFEMTTDTLDNMISGGLYDLVDGGFCRYSTDSEWLVPHFEKMTYDNGLLCKLYLRAYRVFENSRYLEISKEIALFMNNYMLSDGYFYSASDADTNQIEGEYFVYTYSEVINAIVKSGFTAQKAKRMAMRLTTSKDGNFNCKNIIHFANIKKETWFDDIKEALKDIRREREYPFIDKKIQTSWSAMIIQSLFLLSLYEDEYIEKAELVLEKLLLKMYAKKELMHSAIISKEPKVQAYLEDYAYLGITLVSAYEVTSKEKYLKLAQELADDAIVRFYVCGEWKFSTEEFQILADSEDDSYPSSVSVIANLLLSLGTIVDSKYRDIAYETLLYYSSEFYSKPILHSGAIEQVIRYLKEDRILKVPTKTSFQNILEVYKYPFIHVKYHKEDYFELCSNSSCLEKSLTLPTTDSVSP